MCKITVLISNKNNSGLIERFLRGQYTVFQPEKVDFDEHILDTDLVIIDEEHTSALKEELAALKERHESSYLPILLLTDRKHNLPNECLETADELIHVPVGKEEFSLRIANLLQTKKVFDDFKKVLDDSPTGISILQDGRIVYFNGAFMDIFGNGNINLKHLSFKDLLDEKSAKTIEHLITDNGFQTSTPEQETYDIRLDNKEKWCVMSCSHIDYDERPSVLINVVDITRRKAAESELRFASFHDRLTGLYNRNFFETELRRLDSNSKKPSIGIIMLDLNGLKLVNDTYGHQTGDEMLKLTARIIEDTCRKEDIVARWGGDEFVILFPETDEDALEDIGKRIRNNINERQIKDIPLSAALGCGIRRNETQNVDGILHEAEDNMYKQKLTETHSQKNSIVLSFLKILSEKSHETEEHTKRMSVLALKFAERLGLPESELDRLKLLINLHDIGKINIPEKILNKEGPLTEEEWDIIKKHPEIGYRIASATEDFAHVAIDILAHHEHWDGKGYPKGLKGEEIPLLSRIGAIVDAYDVMLNGRPYRKAKSKQEIIEEFERCSGKQFDPELCEHFLDIIKHEPLEE